MIPIRPVPKRYAWGSSTRLQSLMPSMRGVAGPLAELWYGGHPQSPSIVTVRGSDVALDAAVRDDPFRMLGPVASHRWGPMLPYLLKVIAVHRPLSLQVHPLDFEARAGFHRENAAGVPLDAFDRSFRDAHEKSEMVVALDDFRASIGFAPIVQQIAALRLVDCDLARLMVRLLMGQTDGIPSLLADVRLADACMPPASVSWGVPGRSVFRAFWAAVTAGRDGRRSDMRRSVDWLSVLTAARGRIGRTGDRDTVRSAFDNAIDAARSFPDDPSVLALLMMNPVRLQPGEGAFITPGTPHAYIQGMAAEIMTNSDNVLRAGLTVKHRDVPNMLRNLRPLPEPVRRPESFARPDGVLYRPGLDEFSLRLGRAAVEEGGTASAGYPFYETSAIVPAPECASRPRILVCLSGELRCFRVPSGSMDAGAGPSSCTLHGGDAVFIPSADGPISIAASNAVPDGDVVRDAYETTGGAYLLASTGL